MYSTWNESPGDRPTFEQLVHSLTNVDLHESAHHTLEGPVQNRDPSTCTSQAPIRSISPHAYYVLEHRTESSTDPTPNASATSHQQEKPALSADDEIPPLSPANRNSKYLTVEA